MTKLTRMVLENLLQEKESLPAQVQQVACLIRDHWADRLSTGLNALIKNDEPINLNFFRGIFHTISHRDDDKEKLNSWNDGFNNLMIMKKTSFPQSENSSETEAICKKNLADPSWLMRGLAEYTNAHFLAMGLNYDALSHNFCVFMPSEVDYTWKDVTNNSKTNFNVWPYPWFMRQDDTIYSEKISFISRRLKDRNDVHIVLPEVLYYDLEKDQKYHYVRWFLYTFRLKTDMETTTLIITTPRDHVFEVTRGFARQLINDIKSKLKSDSNKIYVIREARLQGKAAKSDMPLFVKSLSSSWFTKQQPPSTDVQAWLRQCQKFLINCGFPFDETFDTKCLCESDCDIPNKIKRK